MAGTETESEVGVGEWRNGGRGDVAQALTLFSTSACRWFDSAPDRQPSTREEGIITVSVPREMATSGAGFSFPLPSQVAQEAGSQAITVRLATGAPLPSWLTFNPTTRTFNASAVPDGAFPVQVVVSAGGRTTTVVISQRTE